MTLGIQSDSDEVSVVYKVKSEFLQEQSTWLVYANRELLQPVSSWLPFINTDVKKGKTKQRKTPNQHQLQGW